MQLSHFKHLANAGELFVDHLKTMLSPTWRKAMRIETQCGERHASEGALRSEGGGLNSYGEGRSMLKET